MRLRLGINRGAERLVSITAQKDITIASDAMNLSLPLHFAEGAKKSRLMKHAAPGIWKTLAEQPMTFNVHQRAIPKEIFTNSSEVIKFYRIISTNKDRNGTVFVSTFEGKMSMYKHQRYSSMYVKISFNLCLSASNHLKLKSMSMIDIFASKEI